MSRLARRAVIATKGGGGGTKTYADFVTHITGLSAGSNSWSGQTFSGNRLTTAAAVVGSMYGSPWSSTFYPSLSSTCRVVQHGLPSLTEFNAQVSLGRTMLMTTSVTAGFSFFSLNRNGYTSLAGEFDEAGSVTRILYWSGTDTGGSAFEMNPSTGTGPTPYTW